MPGISTRTIHAIEDIEHGGTVPPLYTGSNFVQPTGGQEPEYEYARVSNPTRDAVEQTLASLENARHAAVFATGMAATSSVLDILRRGDTVLFNFPVYGGTYRYAVHQLSRRGVDYRFLPDIEALREEDLDESVRMIFLETPTNPTLRVVDLRRITEIARRRGILTACDNTFLTPYLQRPLELGVDLSVQSATKYLAGHGDFLGGVVTTDDDALADWLHGHQKGSGSFLSPTESHRLMQYVKTLRVRMDAQQASAAQIVAALRTHPAVAEVITAGSHSPEERAVQESQADGPGAVFSLRLVPGADLPAFFGALEIFGFAVSLGGVESLVCLPATMTHEAYSPEHQALGGLDAQLIRVAVGIEETEDLLQDLHTALEAATAGLPATSPSEPSPSVTAPAEGALR